MCLGIGVDTVALAVENWNKHGWSAAAPGVAAVTSVMRAQQILQGRLDEALKPWSLTYARYELLMLLHFSGDGLLLAKKL